LTVKGGGHRWWVLGRVTEVAPYPGCTTIGAPESHAGK
jgi:hypothetical protein